MNNEDLLSQLESNRQDFVGQAEQQRNVKAWTNSIKENRGNVTDKQWNYAKSLVDRLRGHGRRLQIPELVQYNYRLPTDRHNMSRYIDFLKSFCDNFQNGEGNSWQTIIRILEGVSNST